MARTFPPHPGSYDDDQLITLCASLQEVSAALKARGINPESDSSLLDMVASDLLSKTDEGEWDQRVLTQYALLKVWGRIWNIEGSRVHQLNKLRKPFTKRS
jgi:hypothetical protein